MNDDLIRHIASQLPAGPLTTRAADEWAYMTGFEPGDVYEALRWRESHFVPAEGGPKNVETWRQHDAAGRRQ